MVLLKGNNNWELILGERYATFELLSSGPVALVSTEAQEMVIISDYFGDLVVNVSAEP